MSKEPAVENKIRSAILWAALLFIVVKAFPLLSPIVLSFFLIFFIALAVNPIVSRVRKLTGGRALGTLLFVFSFLFVLVLTSWAFYAPIKRSTSKFFERLPEYWERVQRPIVRMEHSAVISQEKVKREVAREASGASNGTNGPTVEVVEVPVTTPPPVSNDYLHSGLGQLLNRISNGFQALAWNAASLFIVLITVFVGVIFTLLNPRPILSTIFGLVPEQHHENALKIVRRIVLFIPRWALATLLGMVIIGLMVFFAMWPIFGFQDALVLGLLSTVFEAVPYVGPVLSGIPALLLAVGEGGYTPFWVVIAYLGIQLLEHNLISPVIVAGQLELHPVAVIFSVLICIAAFGILGIIIAVPMVAMIRIIHEEVYRPRFLPNISTEQLELMARTALNERMIPVAHAKSPDAREKVEAQIEAADHRVVPEKEPS